MNVRKAWDMVDAAKQNVENLTIDDLKREWADDPTLIVVDIREIQERVDKGAIPDSKHAPRGMLEFWADPQSEYYRHYFHPDARIVLYCAGGGRSALAAATLQSMGFANVAHLEAGFNGWAAAGEDVEDVSAISRWIRRPTGG